MLSNRQIAQFKRTLFSAVDESSQVLLKYFGKTFEITRKKYYTDLVTEVDKLSETRIVKTIHKDFPEHNILSEEMGNMEMKSDCVWIIDPIDGTVNFAHGIPIFCVSIALEVNKELVMGCVYNPVSGETFYGQKNSGAFFNGRRLQVSVTKKLKDAMLVTGFPYGGHMNADHCIDHFTNFIKAGLPVRRLGSAAIDMCYLAAGKFDGFWEVSLNPWDVAAAYILLTEAGGRITDFNGKKYSIYGRQMLASNGKIHREMINVLKRGYTGEVQEVIY
jgi:myo-inositol-1(or 4)-monophosphatase